MVTVVAVIKDDQFREGLHFLINNSDGCKCLASFSSYSELIEFCTKSLPDLILLDVDISFENAVDTIKKIKSNNKDSVIIVISHNDSDTNVYETISAGACGFLIKAISHSELIESLKEACCGGAPLSSSAAKKLVSFFHKNGQTFIPERNYNLSPREKEVVNMLVEGKKMREVASSLFISIDTVRFHSKNIYRKLKVRNQAELVSKTLREKIIL